MIAIITNREDLHADWLILELDRRGAPWSRVNTEDLPSRTTITWGAGGAYISGSHGSLNARDISAVWWRRPRAGSAPPGQNMAEAAWAQAEAFSALIGFLEAADARWVNHPNANASAGNKLEQLQRAEAHGLSVPPTLVTNEAEAASRFAAEHDRIVCKSISDGRVPGPDGRLHAFLTSEVLAEPGIFDGLGPEPACFQALVPKRHDLRVTVVGDKLFPCSINSQQQHAAEVDWRGGDVSAMGHRSVQLPSAVASAVQSLVRSYGLRFAAVDLIEDQDGKYVFLEINPNGQWAWVEQMTGLPIAARLADELLAHST